MLPFFRKIRWRLARDNQFFKYSRYAIGEIVLVVVGILIALQINNWNEEKKGEQLLKENLSSLKLDLQEDLKVLEFSKETEMFRFYSMKKILDYIGESAINTEELKDFEKMVPYRSNWIYKDSIPKEKNMEFIQVAFSWTGRHVPVNIHKETLEEIKSTGIYSKISSKELKNALNQYYSIVESHLEEHLYTKNYFLETTWEKSLLEDGITYIDVTNVSDPLRYIEKSPFRTGLVKNLMGIAQWRATMAQNSIDQLLIILELIEKELINH